MFKKSIKFFDHLDCDCDEVGRENNVCNKTNGECNCRHGYAGEKCQDCDINFTRNPIPTGTTMTSTSTTITSTTTESTTTTSTTGECTQCVEGYYGYHCNESKY